MSIIYVFNINNLQNKEKFSVLQNSISKIRRKKSERYFFIDDVKRSICAEAIMRYHLITNCGVSNYDIQIAYNKYGKPYLPDFPDFHFNISHSNRWVVCGWSNKKIGIDVEKIVNIDIDIIKKQLCDSEYEYVMQGDYREINDRFIKLWTLKESYIKYIGKGLHISLNTFCISVKDNIVLSYPRIGVHNFYFKQIRFNKDYYLAECSCDDSYIQIIEISIDELISVFQI